MAGAERWLARSVSAVAGHWRNTPRPPQFGKWKKIACVGFSPIRASGNDDDYDVPADGAVVGRIMKANAAPVDEPWLWTLAFGHHEDRTPPSLYNSRARHLRMRLSRSKGPVRQDKLTQHRKRGQNFVPPPKRNCCTRS